MKEKSDVERNHQSYPFFVCFALIKMMLVQTVGEEGDIKIPKNIFQSQTPGYVLEMQL